MIAILSMVLVLGIGSATVFAEKAPEITESISEELERNGLPEGNISKEKNSNPYGIQAYSAKALTLSELKSKFPAGKYWNHAGRPGSSNSVNNQDGYTSTPCPQHKTVGTSKQTCNGFAPGGTQLSWQCMGYAEKLGYDSTGFNPRVNANGWSTSTSSSALNNLKAGDIVRYKNNGHSIFVTAVNGDTVTYTDCNSDGHCIIRWDQKISKATLRASFTHVRIAPRTLVTNEGHNPQGMVDSAGGGFSKVGAAGWAFDADNYGAALEVHIYMDGKLLGTTVANLYRPDVNNVYKCGDYHGYAFETEVDASMSGEHTLDVYAINVGGGAPSVLLASKKVTISQDKEAPVISDIQVMDITANSYVVSCRVTDNTEVNRVQFPTWSAVNGQDDIVPNWPVNAAASGTRNGDIYTYTVNIADHNNDRGIYATHIYAYDKYGNCSSARVDTIEILELPEIEYDLGDDFFAIVENAYVHTALKKIHNGQTQDAIFSDKDGTREQMWHFVRNSRNEPYTIYCEGNEALVLDVSGGIDADKRNVTTWVENGSDAQKWYIRKKDGLYYLQPCCSSTRVLDVPGGQSGERNAQIYSYNTDHGTGMNIIKVDPVKVELSEEKLLTTGNYNGHRYEVFDQGMNWTDAKRSCILRGGHLVTITDAGEQEFIEKLLTNGTMNQYWLGFKKYGRNFAWITGENSEYEHWDAGEPTNGGADISYPGREYCAHIYNKTNPANGGKRFYWNDINSSNTLVNELDFFNTDVVGVICEYDYIENYTLTYDANEGVNPPKSESYEQGSTAKVTNVEPTRRGYEFVGWALKESAENAEYHAGDEIKITKNITLYAVWKAETNHNWDAGTVISEATCAKTGTIVYHCSICEETRTETIPKKEHTIVKDNAVEATCEIEGKTEGSHCSVCNTVIKKQEFVPKKEHSWNSGEIIREATCTKDGIKKITCTVCKETKIEIITQKVHTIVRDEAIPATCKETGKTAGSHCSVCNTVIQAQETIPKTEHSWDAGTIVEEASCTEEGIEKITCTVCEESKTEKVAPAGHIVVKDEAIEATCTTTGKTEGSHCDVCNEVLQEQKVIPKKGHTVVKDEAVEATCTATGKTEGSHCSVCNTVIQAQEIIPKTDHRWDDGEIVTEATCTEAGIKKISCTVCGESRTEKVEATGHTVVKDEAVEATCTAIGKTEGSHCSVCNEVIQAQEVIPKTDHRWDDGEIVTEATCTETGIKKISCTVCGESKTESVAPTGHTVVKDEAVEATCTATGKTEGSHCSVCNEVLQEQAVIPQTEHSWDDGEIVTEATCTEAGIKKISCTVCGESYTEEIPAAGHTYGEYQIVKEATETEEGILVRNCSVCGKAEFVTIPKVTNPDKDPDQKPDNQETEQKPEDKGNTDKDQQQTETPDTKPNQNQQTAKKTTKKIKLNRKKLTLKKGKTFKLKVTLTPADSQDKIVYKTSNRKIATVSKTGKIKAKKKGKVKITVISGKKKAVCTVKVK